MSYRSSGNYSYVSEFTAFAQFLMDKEQRNISRARFSPPLRNYIHYWSFPRDAVSRSSNPGTVVSCIRAVNFCRGHNNKRTMDYQDRAIIDNYCDYFSTKINMPALWPRLIINRVFNEDDVNVPLWKGKLADQGTARKILLTIKTRGPRAYDNLILSLRQTNQHQLADILQARELSAMDNRNDGSPGGDHPTRDSSMNDDFYKKLKTSDKPLRIVVRKATKFRDGPEYETLGRYWMRSKPRGRVLLITNITSLTGQKREAAEHDEANLKALFQDMGFEVIAEKNLTGSEMKKVVNKFSSEDWCFIDSCFVIISAHGAEAVKNGCPETELQGTDYGFEHAERVLCTDIYEYFSAENCKPLIGKPKIFIFQACRGKKKQPSVKIVSDGSDKATPRRNYSDMLIAHSTLPGHVAYRNTGSGSWYIQILCEVFMNYACDLHIRDLFDMVDRRLMDLRAEDDRCQTSTVKSMGFNKHCYLNPGLFEDP